MRPAWTVALDSDPLDATAIAELRKSLPETRLGMWFVEGHRSEPGAWWTEVAPLLDRFFAMEGETFAPAARAAGVRYHWLPAACDASVARAEPVGKRSGLVFVGSCRPARVALFLGLRAAGLPLRLLGPKWSQVAALADCVVQDGWVDETTEAAAYRSALVAVNLHDANPTADFVNPRTFTAAGCGALVLCDPRPDLARLFPPDEIEICEDTILAARAQQLLNESVTTGNRGLAASRTVHARHTYFHRAQEMLAVLAAKDESGLPGFGSDRDSGHRLDNG